MKKNRSQRPKLTLNLPLLLPLCALPLAALAQQAPDAGRLLEQTRPAPNAPQPARPVITPPPAAPELPADNSPVAISRFVFEGNSALSSTQLAELLKDQISPATPFGQLRAALSRLNTAYAAQGYFLARAVIPRQDLSASGGVLRIQILEGRLGKVAGSNASAEQLALARATLAAQGIEAGLALRLEPLERSLLLISERLGGQSSATLAPGSLQGGTDVNLQTPAAQRRWSAQIGMDNAGNRFSGSARLLADASVRDVGMLGDALLLRSQLAQGLRFLGAAYQLPLGHQGWQLDLNASHLSYSLCCTFAPLQAKGSVSQLGVGIRYPLVLRSDHSLIADAAYNRKHSQDRSLGITNSDKVATPLNLGLAWSSSAAFEGRLLQSGKLNFVSGQLKQRLAPNPNLPKRYSKWRGDYSATVLAGVQQQWLLKASGQAAGSNLDSSEKFSLGGASGVRGWPAGEASGDHGALLSAEWRYQLNSASRSISAGQSPLSPQNHGVWTLSVFADAGQITQQKNPTATSLPPGIPNSYSLSSAGVGMAYRSSGGWNLGAQLAKGLGDNPGKSAAGLNSDGRKKNTQLWVNVGMRF